MSKFTCKIRTTNNRPLLRKERYQITELLNNQFRTAAVTIEDFSIKTNKTLFKRKIKGVTLILEFRVSYKSSINLDIKLNQLLESLNSLLSEKYNFVYPEIIWGKTYVI
ncbi:hypothetical protein C0583_06455 [Candidatus Parcubacteria bacterium]|nr:MAG: hypothetical protein C0583_06455 [Candidatus Parcubacteria bacterium]